MSHAGVGVRWSSTLWGGRSAHHPGGDMGPIREGPWMAIPGSLAVGYPKVGAQAGRPPQGAVPPQPCWGGTGPGRHRSKLGRVSFRHRPLSGPDGRGPCPGNLAMPSQHSVQRGDREGCHQPGRPREAAISIRHYITRRRLGGSAPPTSSAGGAWESGLVPLLHRRVGRRYGGPMAPPTLMPPRPIKWGLRCQPGSSRPGRQTPQHRGSWPPLPRAHPHTCPPTC